ncbi:MAG TPA: hypothetical protein DDY78_30210 [Planctomycetales bacterium]|jgi:hypothetical protein|nr:hypothetical protein [Planctomycetales bacterium]
MTLLRRLNAVGMERLAGFLDSLKTEMAQGAPVDILTHPDTSQDVGVAIEIEPRTFGSRLEAARYLDGKLSDSGLRDVERDIGLWGWLALFYFDELCPADKRGRRDPGEQTRYILEPRKGRRYYKHLLAGPYLIVRAHRDNPDRALALLHGPLHFLSEFVNQLAARQETVTNKALLQAITYLYIDPKTREPKQRARSKGPGGPRRLATILNQLDVTWDLYAVTTESFLECLPPEFDRFKAGIPETTAVQR